MSEFDEYDYKPTVREGWANSDVQPKKHKGKKKAKKRMPLGFRPNGKAGTN